MGYFVSNLIIVEYGYVQMHILDITTVIISTKTQPIPALKPTEIALQKVNKVCCNSLFYRVCFSEATNQATLVEVVHETKAQMPEAPSVLIKGTDP